MSGSILVPSVFSVTSTGPGPQSVPKNNVFNEYHHISIPATEIQPRAPEKRNQNHLSQFQLSSKVWLRSSDFKCVNSEDHGGLCTGKQVNEGMSMGPLFRTHCRDRLKRASHTAAPTATETHPVSVPKCLLNRQKQ